MDEQKQNQSPNEPLDDKWLDEILGLSELQKEIGPDEQAVSAAGLIHPDDAELERIIEETKQPLEEARELTSETDETTFFSPERVPASPQTDNPPPVTDGYVDDAYAEEEAEEEDSQIPSPPMPKRRPHRKKGYGLFGLPHLAATVIWLAIAVSIGTAMGRMLWLCASDMLAFGRTSQEITVTLTDSDNIDTIASKLRNAGLIRYPNLFKVFVDIKGDTEALSTGTFKLNTLYDYNALVNALKPHSPAREEVEILIPEGYTCAQIFARLEEQNVCTVEELEAYAANGDLDDYWFLEGVVRGTRYCLEGYLFPNTYRFYVDDEPRRVLQKFLNSFEDNFTELMAERIETVNATFAQMLEKHGYDQAYIDSHRLTLHQLVTISSIVEKESANSTESYTVASVFLNRLANQQNYPFLQSDATVYYAIGGASNEELTADDLAVDSPYNTYKYAGLTPGPISNPGQASLNAALDPDITDYYFFFYDTSAGVHRFARNLAEHNENIKKYGD